MHVIKIICQRYSTVRQKYRSTGKPRYFVTLSLRNSFSKIAKLTYRIPSLILSRYLWICASLITYTLPRTWNTDQTKIDQSVCQTWSDNVTFPPSSCPYPTPSFRFQLVTNQYRELIEHKIEVNACVACLVLNSFLITWLAQSHAHHVTQQLFTEGNERAGMKAIKYVPSWRQHRGNWIGSGSTHWRKQFITEINPFIANNIILFTDADDSRVNKTFSGVCVCLCLFVRMIKPKRLKLKPPNLAHG